MNLILHIAVLFISLFKADWQDLTSSVWRQGTITKILNVLIPAYQTSVLYTILGLPCYIRINNLLFRSYTLRCLLILSYYLVPYSSIYLTRFARIMHKSHSH